MFAAVDDDGSDIENSDVGLAAPAGASGGSIFSKTKNVERKTPATVAGVLLTGVA